MDNKNTQRINEQEEIKQTNNKKTQKKKRKGFTLIELLAVIIILGVLMIIAIPAVTSYISDSRKSAYVDTAKEIIASTRTKVNEGKLNTFDMDATYYIPAKCIPTETGGQSPYGEFTQAYIGVIYEGNNFRYFWISNDTTGQGINKITTYDDLDKDNIVGNIKDSEILDTIESTGIEGRTKIYILKDDCKNWNEPKSATKNLDSNGTVSDKYICKKATTLHKATCTASDYGCLSSGYTATGSMGTTTITYGTIPNGTPKAGDAYDCKLKTNGKYSERFYYVGSSGENSILIYYKNINNNSTYAYNSNAQNWYGPSTIYQYLPSTTEWNNPKIIAPSEPRNIITEKNTSSTNGGNIGSFTYTNKAARLLTYGEVQKACNKINITTGGSIESCNWLMESLERYEMGYGVYAYWLETPSSNSSSNVWSIVGSGRNAYSYNSGNQAYGGLRPVITVKTSDIEQ